MSSPGRIGTTFNGFRVVGFAHDIDTIETCYIPPEKHRLLDEIHRVIQILGQSGDKSCLILNSASGRLQPDVLAALCLRFRRRRPHIVLAGDMWEPSGGLRGLVESLVVRMADPAISAYVVHTTEEVRTFPERWGVRAEKVRRSPYYHYVTSDILEQEVPERRFVFSGGNSKRDYEPLIEAARMLPDIEFVIATHLLEGRGDIPPNVTFGPMSHWDYYLSVKSAAAVVTPIRTNLVRAAGQQTYLNAMRLGRPVIVNDTFGVRDHIRNNVDGIIVDGSPRSYRDAICRVLDPANETHVRSMVQSALHRAETEFTRTRYLERIYDIARTVSSGT